MSKGIIVEDVPECCDLCGYSSQAYDLEPFEEGECYCTIKKKSIDKIPEGEKPDWCPIRPIPDKREHKTVQYNYDGGYSRGFTACWNMFIDELLKGGEPKNESDCIWRKC